MGRCPRCCAVINGLRKRGLAPSNKGELLWAAKAQRPSGTNAVLYTLLHQQMFLNWRGVASCDYVELPRAAQEPSAQRPHRRMQLLGRNNRALHAAMPARWFKLRRRFVRLGRAASS